MTKKKKRYVILKPKCVIGPLPDGSSLIILGAMGKLFPIKASLADGASCQSVLNGDYSGSPYKFISYLFSESNFYLSIIKLIMVEKDLYGSIYYKSCFDEKILKTSTDNPSECLNISLVSNKNLLIEESVFKKIKDSTEEFSVLKSNFGTLWPLNTLTNTEDLIALSDYIEKSFPIFE